MQGVARKKVTPPAVPRNGDRRPVPVLKSDDRRHGKNALAPSALRLSPVEDEEMSPERAKKLKLQKEHQDKSVVFMPPQPSYESKAREDEANETLRRAKLIRAGTGLKQGQTIPEAMQDVSADVLAILREVMTPEPEKDLEQKHFVPMLYEADHKEQAEKEHAALRVQSIFRGNQSRKSVKDKVEEKKVIKERHAAMQSHILQSLDAGLTEFKSVKDVGWDPQELKHHVNELLDSLNCDDTEKCLQEADTLIRKRAADDMDTILDVQKRLQSSEKTMLNSDIWLAELHKKLNEKKLKTSDHIYNCSTVGKSMAEMGHTAQEKRTVLRALVETEAHLKLEAQDHTDLAEKKLYVQFLGKRLVEIRSVQEHSGPQETDVLQVAELESTIKDSEGELATLYRWMENIERYMRTLEQTLEYLERNQAGPVPDEGVLETLEEVKGSIRKARIEPMLIKHDAENVDSLKMPDNTEVLELEAESQRMQDMLEKMLDAVRQVPDTAFHEEKVKRRMAQICGPFKTMSGLLEQGPLPDVNAASVPDLRDSFLNHLEQVQQNLKPGLKQLQRFEAMMQHAQQSLNFLESQRGIVVEHVKAMKDTLVSETMSVDTTPYNPCPWLMFDNSKQTGQEDRWRQTIRAFHDVEEKLIGDVDEVDARLNFAKHLVQQGLDEADKLRRYCDRNRWETQDCLANCVVDRYRSDPTDMPVVAFDRDRSKLVNGAISCRNQHWEKDLKERILAGKEKAKISREVMSQKAAMAAEVEAPSALGAVQFSAHPSDDEDDDEDEPGLPFTSSRRNTPILNQAARDAKRSGSPPPTVEGKKGLAGIVGKSKFGKLLGKHADSLLKTGKGKAKASPKKAKKDGGRVTITGADGLLKNKKDGTAKNSSAETAGPDSPTDKGKPSDTEADAVPVADAGIAYASEQSNDVEEERKPTPVAVAAQKKMSVAQGQTEAVLPTIPPPAKSVQDIQALHVICLDLARQAQEADTTCRGLATRLGGHPLDPTRNHLLLGDQEEKEKVTKSMSSLIAGRKSWWQARQSLSMRGQGSSTQRHSKEAAACDETRENLRRAMHDDMGWLQQFAARKLQSFLRPSQERKRNTRLRKTQEKLVVNIQKAARGWAVRKSLARDKALERATRNIQRVFRGSQDRAAAKRWKFVVVFAAKRLQRHARRRHLQPAAVQGRLEIAAAIDMQRLARGFLARRLAKSLLDAIEDRGRQEEIQQAVLDMISASPCLSALSSLAPSRSESRRGSEPQAANESSPQSLTFKQSANFVRSASKKKTSGGGKRKSSKETRGAPSHTVNIYSHDDDDADFGAESSDMSAFRRASNQSEAWFEDGENVRRASGMSVALLPPGSSHRLSTGSQPGSGCNTPSRLSVVNSPFGVEGEPRRISAGFLSPTISPAGTPPTRSGANTPTRGSLLVIEGLDATTVAEGEADPALPAARRKSGRTMTSKDTGKDSTRRGSKDTGKDSTRRGSRKKTEKIVIPPQDGQQDSSNKKTLSKKQTSDIVDTTVSKEFSDSQSSLPQVQPPTESPNNSRKGSKKQPKAQPSDNTPTTSRKGSKKRTKAHTNDSAESVLGQIEMQMQAQASEVSQVEEPLSRDMEQLGEQPEEKPDGEGSGLASVRSDEDLEDKPNDQLTQEVVQEQDQLKEQEEQEEQENQEQELDAGLEEAS